jgi:hypothetical protein
VSKAENWQGPDAIVAIRNGIVHRNRKKREQSGKKKLESHDLLNEAYTLLCWYVERVLLRHLEFEGEYSNRLKKRVLGQVETTPWKTVDDDGNSDA